MIFSHFLTCFLYIVIIQLTLFMIDVALQQVNFSYCWSPPVVAPCGRMVVQPGLIFDAVTVGSPVKLFEESIMSYNFLYMLGVAYASISWHFLLVGKVGLTPMTLLFTPFHLMWEVIEICLRDFTFG
jgi:hypothetical protein